MTDLEWESKALLSLFPDAQWGQRDGGLEWFSDDIEQPTTTEIDAEVIRLQAEYDANQYQRDRASEYPSIADLVEALYDTDDKSAVEAKRAEVKTKYPKPS